jgi:hypothetical protein
MTIKPSACHLPVPFHRAFVDLKELGDFRVTEPPEATHLNDLGHARFLVLKALQQFSDDTRVQTPVYRQIEVPELQLNGRTTASVSTMSPGVVDEVTAHCLSRQGEKVLSVVPLEIGFAHHLEKELVHKSSGLESVIASLP